MERIFNIGKKYFYIGQGYLGERCGLWASCFEKYLRSKIKYSLFAVADQPT
jgi:hypothetical protein